ncbi:EF-hand domain-containing protein [Streptomyces sp. NPDC048623]|uniref:EF-hand domain-containing protein n=1 Tax=Streptomyces sp. NPDC048623 TaxID=3155761 RepID=UPI003436454F
MTSTTLKKQKFSVLFDWFNQGKDGHLKQDDLQEMAGRFAGLAKDDHASATAVRNSFEAWWQLLLEHGDGDGDGRISRDEFIAVMGTDVVEGAIFTMADALMQALDTDGDGTLSRTEYVSMYDGLGIAREHSEAAFERLDRDGNGVISSDEWRLALREFYLSTDPEAPGNWLLGPVAPAV